MAVSHDKSPFMTAMRWAGKLLPGDKLKTLFYMKCIAAPRGILRNYTHTFYRMEMMHRVLREFRDTYAGPFSVLEFGTALGYAYAKMLYTARYLGMEDQARVYSFDSFEGLRPPDDEDKGLVSNPWGEGHYLGDFEQLKAYCDEQGYQNARIHKGYFEDSLTPDVIEELKTYRPVLVWVDCDYYTSTVTLFERILPVLQSGCVFYFDDYHHNYGSRFTGEARFIHELNQGQFGKEFELIIDRGLGLDSDSVYRFLRADEGATQFERLPHMVYQGRPRPISNGSLLP